MQAKGDDRRATDALADIGRGEVLSALPPHQRPPLRALLAAPGGLSAGRPGCWQRLVEEVHAHGDGAPAAGTASLAALAVRPEQVSLEPADDALAVGFLLRYPAVALAWVHQRTRSVPPDIAQVARARWLEKAALLGMTSGVLRNTEAEAWLQAAHADRPGRILPALFAGAHAHREYLLLGALGGAPPGDSLDAVEVPATTGRAGPLLAEVHGLADRFEGSGWNLVGLDRLPDSAALCAGLDALLEAAPADLRPSQLVRMVEHAGRIEDVAALAPLTTAAGAEQSENVHRVLAAAWRWDAARARRRLPDDPLVDAYDLLSVDAARFSDPDLRREAAAFPLGPRGLLGWHPDALAFVEAASDWLSDPASAFPKALRRASGGTLDEATATAFRRSAEAARQRLGAAAPPAGAMAWDLAGLCFAEEEAADRVYARGISASDPTETADAVFAYLDFAPPRRRLHPETDEKLLGLIKKVPWTLLDLPADLRGRPEFLHALAEHCPEAMAYAPRVMLADPVLRRAALTHDRGYLKARGLSESLRSNPAAVLDFFRAGVTPRPLPALEVLAEAEPRLALYQRFLPADAEAPKSAPEHDEWLRTERAVLSSLAIAPEDARGLVRIAPETFRLLPDPLRRHPEVVRAAVKGSAANLWYVDADAASVFGGFDALWHDAQAPVDVAPKLAARFQACRTGPEAFRLALAHAPQDLLGLDHWHPALADPIAAANCLMHTPSPEAEPVSVWRPSPWENLIERLRANQTEAPAVDVGGEDELRARGLWLPRGARLAPDAARKLLDPDARPSNLAEVWRWAMALGVSVQPELRRVAGTVSDPEGDGAGPFFGTDWLPLLDGRRSAQRDQAAARRAAHEDPAAPRSPRPKRPGDPASLELSSADFRRAARQVADDGRALLSLPDRSHRRHPQLVALAVARTPGILRKLARQFDAPLHRSVLRLGLWSALSDVEGLAPTPERPGAAAEIWHAFRERFLADRRSIETLVARVAELPAPSGRRILIDALDTLAEVSPYGGGALSDAAPAIRWAQSELFGDEARWAAIEAKLRAAVAAEAGPDADPEALRRAAVHQWAEVAATVPGADDLWTAADIAAVSPSALRHFPPSKRRLLAWLYPHRLDEGLAVDPAPAWALLADPSDTAGALVRDLFGTRRAACLRLLEASRGVPESFEAIAGEDPDLWRAAIELQAELLFRAPPALVTDAFLADVLADHPGLALLLHALNRTTTPWRRRILLRDDLRAAYSDALAAAQAAGIERFRDWAANDRQFAELVAIRTGRAPADDRPTIAVAVAVEDENGALGAATQRFLKAARNAPLRVFMFNAERPAQVSAEVQAAGAQSPIHGLILSGHSERTAMEYRHARVGAPTGERVLRASHADALAPAMAALQSDAPVFVLGCSAAAGGEATPNLVRAVADVAGPERLVHGADVPMNVHYRFDPDRRVDSSDRLLPGGLRLSYYGAGVRKLIQGGAGAARRPGAVDALGFAVDPHQPVVEAVVEDGGRCGATR